MRSMRRATEKTNRPPTHLDIAFLDGHILTLDRRERRAQALGIERGRISRIGTNQHILSAVSRDTRIVDLHGATVLPGFTDCHTHLVAYGLELFGANLREARSISEIQAILTQQARKLGPGKWLLGYGWDQEKFEERKFPSRFDLDAAVPDRPVCIFRICGHMCIVNSEALRVANITVAQCVRPYPRV
jgi:predicted amidohydrolase YtcJ